MSTFERCDEELVLPGSDYVVGQLPCSVVSGARDHRHRDRGLRFVVGGEHGDAAVVIDRATRVRVLGKNSVRLFPQGLNPGQKGFGYMFGSLWRILLRGNFFVKKRL
jgi:hypothetical protein